MKGKEYIFYIITGKNCLTFRKYLGIYSKKKKKISSGIFIALFEVGTIKQLKYCNNLVV